MADPWRDLNRGPDADDQMAASAFVGVFYRVCWHDVGPYAVQSRRSDIGFGRNEWWVDVCAACSAHRAWRAVVSKIELAAPIRSNGGPAPRPADSPRDIIKTKTDGSPA
jgi:hypothetical protein